MIRSSSQTSLVFIFDGVQREIRLQIDSMNHVTLFDSLPEHWIPAVALLREGDSVSVDLLPSITSVSQETRWCDLYKSYKGDVYLAGEVSENVVRVVEFVLQDLVAHLNEGELSQNRLYSMEYCFETKTELSERLHLSDARYDLSDFTHERAVDASFLQMPHSNETPSIVESPKPVQRILGMPPGAVSLLSFATALSFNGSARRSPWIEKQRIGDS